MKVLEPLARLTVYHRPPKADHVPIDEPLGVATASLALPMDVPSDIHSNPLTTAVHHPTAVLEVAPDSGWEPGSHVEMNDSFASDTLEAALEAHLDEDGQLFDGTDEDGEEEEDGDEVDEEGDDDSEDEDAEELGFLHGLGEAGDVELVLADHMEEGQE